MFVVDPDTPDFVKALFVNEMFVYRGENAPEHGLRYLIDKCNELGNLLNGCNISMETLTSADIHRFRTTLNCEMCNRVFTEFNGPVRDHCHLTGLFRAVLCNECNLKRQSQKFLPVFLHGSSSYDNHFLMRQLGIDTRHITVIPNTNEKYISFSKRTACGLYLRFLDTYRFLNSSLSKLAENLSADQFAHTSKVFAAQDMPYVTRKGVYPYDYTDSWERFEETELPCKEDFYNVLTDSHIDESDFQHATNVWNHFNIRTLGEYSDLYLKIDVLLLCDIFENFRHLCITNYGIDCAHYLTLPSYTFDAMLLYTGVHLDLLTDYDMYLYLENGIRGGVVSCVEKHAMANNPYIPETHDTTRSNNYLMYWDSNNQYGWAMSSPMPHSGFAWRPVDPNFDVMRVPDDSSVGYILEVDVDYPRALHDDHEEFPFLPVGQVPSGSKYKKLLTTLEPKTHYISYYRNLKQAVEHGLRITKIHRILRFNQSPWLKPYIAFNTSKRQLAKNDFEKDFYKVVNNAMFGKTFENVKNRLNLELVSNPRRLDKLIAKASFLDRVIYDESLCAVTCAKEKVFLDKPLYVGFTVLEISKLGMYDFHYDVIKPKYGQNCKLLYTDTDSFLYNIVTDDVYADMSSLSDHLDTSDYPPAHPAYSVANKKVLGKFKDETVGEPIKEYVGLKSKLYSFLMSNLVEVKKAKGIKKSVVANKMSFNDFKNCLFSNSDNCSLNPQYYREMAGFHSNKHLISTVITNKLALSKLDDKRVSVDITKTLPYGHYKLDV